MNASLSGLHDSDYTGIDLALSHQLDIRRDVSVLVGVLLDDLHGRFDGYQVMFDSIVRKLQIDLDRLIQVVKSRLSDTFDQNHQPWVAELKQGSLDLVLINGAGIHQLLHRIAIFGVVLRQDGELSGADRELVGL